MTIQGKTLGYGVLSLTVVQKDLTVVLGPAREELVFAVIESAWLWVCFRHYSILSYIIARGDGEGVLSLSKMARWVSSDSDGLGQQNSNQKEGNTAFLVALGFWRMYIPEDSQTLSPLYLVTQEE